MNNEVITPPADTDAASVRIPSQATGSAPVPVLAHKNGVVEHNEKLRSAALKFAATVVMLNRRAMLLPPESDRFEAACAELNQALMPNAML